MAIEIMERGAANKVVASSEVTRQVYVCPRCAHFAFAHELVNETFDTCKRPILPLSSYMWKLAGKLFTLQEFTLAVDAAKAETDKVAAVKATEHANKMRNYRPHADTARPHELSLMAARNERWQAGAHQRRMAALASLGGCLGIEKPLTSTPGLLDGHFNVAPERG